MFTNSRQFAQAMKKLEDDVLRSQKEAIEEWRVKADAAVERVNNLCDAIEEKYPDVKNMIGEQEDDA